MKCGTHVHDVKFINGIKFHPSITQGFICNIHLELRVNLKKKLFHLANGNLVGADIIPNYRTGLNISKL